MAQERDSRSGSQPDSCDEEIKALLKARARFRVFTMTIFVFFALATLVVLSSPSLYEKEVSSRPRTVLLVVPHLSPDMLEAAMASNKAPFLHIISAVNGSYTQLHSTSTDITASLVTILTGNASTGMVNLAGATSFLGRLKRAGKRPVVLAPPLYWTTRGPVDGSCGSVGLLDAECLGASCQPATPEAYCNAVEKLLTCEGKAQLYGEDAMEGFIHLLRNDGDILYVHMDITTGAATSDEERMAFLSDISVMDGTIGKLALAAMERSRTISESWLLMVVGAGDSSLEKVPLAMAAYVDGDPVRLRPLPKGATLADVSPTVLDWHSRA